MQFTNYTNRMAVISRRKLNGLGDHWGVLLPNGMVAHNAEGQDITIVPINVFASGIQVEFIREVEPQQWISTNWRLQQELRNPKKYDLILNNCETFANRITGKVPASDQVIGVAILSILVMLLASAK